MERDRGYGMGNKGYGMVLYCGMDWTEGMVLAWFGVS